METSAILSYPRASSRCRKACLYLDCNERQWKDSSRSHNNSSNCWKDFKKDGPCSVSQESPAAAGGGCKMTTLLYSEECCGEVPIQTAITRVCPEILLLDWCECMSWLWFSCCRYCCYCVIQCGAAIMLRVSSFVAVARSFFGHKSAVVTLSSLRCHKSCSDGDSLFFCMLYVAFLTSQSIRAAACFFGFAHLHLQLRGMRRAGWS